MFLVEDILPISAAFVKFGQPGLQS